MINTGIPQVRSLTCIQNSHEVRNKYDSLQQFSPVDHLILNITQVDLPRYTIVLY